MLKKPTKDNPQARKQSVIAFTRTYEPEEFDADTDEERPIAILAEKRRQLLAMLNAREPQSDK